MIVALLALVLGGCISIHARLAEIWSYGPPETLDAAAREELARSRAALSEMSRGLVRLSLSSETIAAAAATSLQVLPPRDVTVSAVHISTSDDGIQVAAHLHGTTDELTYDVDAAGVVMISSDGSNLFLHPYLTEIDVDSLQYTGIDLADQLLARALNDAIRADLEQINGGIRPSRHRLGMPSVGLGDAPLAVATLTDASGLHVLIGDRGAPGDPRPAADEAYRPAFLSLATEGGAGMQPGLHFLAAARDRLLGEQCMSARRRLELRRAEVGAAVLAQLNAAPLPAAYVHLPTAQLRAPLEAALRRVERDAGGLTLRLLSLSSGQQEVEATLGFEVGIADVATRGSLVVHFVVETVEQRTSFTPIVSGITLASITLPRSPDVDLDWLARGASRAMNAAVLPGLNAHLDALDLGAELPEAVIGEGAAGEPRTARLVPLTYLDGEGIEVLLLTPPSEDVPTPRAYTEASDALSDLLAASTVGPRDRGPELIGRVDAVLLLQTALSQLAAAGPLELGPVEFAPNQSEASIQVELNMNCPDCRRAECRRRRCGRRSGRCNRSCLSCWRFLGRRMCTDRPECLTQRAACNVREEAAVAACNAEATAAHAACDAQAEYELLACNVSREACNLALNVVREAGDVGRARSSISGSAQASLSDFYLSIGDELPRRLRLEGLLRASARVDGELRFSPRDIGHLVCTAPTRADLELELSAPARAIATDLSLELVRELPDGGIELRLAASEIEVAAETTIPPAEAMLIQNPNLIIQCSPAGALLAAGMTLERTFPLGGAERLVDLLGGDSEQWRRLFQGRIRQRFDIDPMRVEVPALRVQLGTDTIPLRPAYQDGVVTFRLGSGA